MIEYIKGDLFSTDCNVIAHGCNCSGGFGSGVAQIVKKLYPQVCAAYLKKYQDSGLKLGEVEIVSIGNNKYIANCATQQYYGNSAKSGTVYVDYAAIRSVMEKLYKLTKEENLSVAIPKIGAGLAGGDWNQIESIINEVFHDRTIKVYVL